MYGCICNHCLFQDLCAPRQKLLNNNTIHNCNNFIDINNFYLEEIQESGVAYIWKEMSWNKYTDNLFNYVEDNKP